MSMMYIRILVGLHIKYYTDSHNVDEDPMTISAYGGDYLSAVFAGIAERDTTNTPTDYNYFVASMCRHLRNL